MEAASGVADAAGAAAEADAARAERDARGVERRKRETRSSAEKEVVEEVRIGGRRKRSAIGAMRGPSSGAVATRRTLTKTKTRAKKTRSRRITF